MSELSPAQAYWNQRHVLVDCRDRILALYEAVDRPTYMSLFQAAQLMAFVLEFAPDVILEIGQSAANTTCVFTEAANRLKPHRCRVLSLGSATGVWEEGIPPTVSRIVPESWFEPLQVFQTDILELDYSQALEGYEKILVFWDEPGYEVAECVLGQILPIIASRPHVVIMHDLSDARYLPPSCKNYGEHSLWKRSGENARLRLGHIDSAVEQAVAITDFASRNGLPLHSADHSLHTELGDDPTRMSELQKALGNQLFSLEAHWFWFSLNEIPGPYTFPRFGTSTASRQASLILTEPWLGVTTGKSVNMDSGVTSTDLSVVVTARNDDHGGNLLHRMQLFVNGLLEQGQRHQLKAELVLVEWNPPPDRPRLREALSWPMEKGPCTVRVIEVPPEIHKRFRFSDVLPLFQMIAKNVGIRRAGGKFVLATNIDLLFSDELMRFLASGRLRKGQMYRVDRYDVPADVPSAAPIEAQLEYCRQNVIRINAREGTDNLQTGQFHWIYQKDWRVKLSEGLQDWGLIPITNRAVMPSLKCSPFTWTLSSVLRLITAGLERKYCLIL